jgi:DNA helicase HerA-like ATPase
MAQLFIGSVVRRLLRERMRKPGVPILLIVDEAHRLMSATTSPTATRSFRFIAQEGRKFGVTLLLATQRPGLVDQTILSQCATMIAMRLASPDDARVVSQATAEIRTNELGSLTIGQGLIRRASSADVLWVDFEQAATGKSPEPRSHVKPVVLQQLLLEED